VPIAWAVVPGGGDVEGEGGHYSLRPVGVGGSVHWSCLGLYCLVDSIHDIACPGSRWAITMWWLLIGLFKFKFDYLNINLIVF
jgi:hypothetical protein